MTGHDRRLLRWLVRRDPGLRTTRRALRVAAAASVTFLAGNYLLGDVTVAVFGVFGVIAFGVLSELVGSPSERGRTLLGCFLVGVPLLVLGSLLAGNTVAAAGGMLVVGIVLGLAVVGGPRVAGVVAGLELLYILPSFPPADPASIPARVGGLAAGMLVLAVADRWLLPVRAPRRYTSRLAGAAAALAAWMICGPGGEKEAARRAAAWHATERLRARAVPWSERPTGPGARSQAQAFLAAALIALRRRWERVVGTAAAVDPARRPTAAVVAAAGRTLDGGPAPDVRELEAAWGTIAAEGRARAAGPGGARAAEARALVSALQLVDEGRVVAREACVASGLPPPTGAFGDRVPGEAGDVAAGVARRAPWAPWWARLRARCSPRSVVLQNAVRLGLGLAVARLVAGGLDLSHGFWVLLAVLTIMQTSAATTGARLVPTVAGTAVGATVAAGLLTVVGGDDLVYAVMLPVLLVLAVLAGQLFGLPVAQACFTVLVAALFAQVAPATWTLAGVRLLDVAVGATIGIVAGVVVWPAGAHGQVRRDAARALADSAELVERGVAVLVGPGSRRDLADAVVRARHDLVLCEETWAQYAAERGGRLAGRSPEPDWAGVLGVAHGVARGARAVLLGAAGEAPADRWPALAEAARRRAEATAARCRAFADDLAGETAPHPRTPASGPRGAEPDPAATDLDRALADVAAARDRSAHPEAAVRLVEAWGWLADLDDTLRGLPEHLGPPRRRLRPRRRFGSPGECRAHYSPIFSRHG